LRVDGGGGGEGDAVPTSVNKLAKNDLLISSVSMSGKGKEKHRRHIFDG
jgi:hypothetical protein